jgi:transposase
VHNQIRDLLETVNIKLSSVASDVMGVRGRSILKAIAEGMDSPERLSWKARGSLRNKEQQIKESLQGDYNPFFRKLLETHLRHYDFLSGQVEQLEGQIVEHTAPYQEQIRLLSTIPGVDRTIAWNVLGEMGG